MPSDKNFTFQFTNQPREINAFGIDYDADTTEVHPLIKTGKDQFTFGKVYGTLTLEVRAIFNDGIYATYTCLVDIKNTARLIETKRRPQTYLAKLQNLEVKS